MYTMWTFCFVLLWLLVAAGTLLLHIVVDGVLPTLQKLPGNIESGFSELLRFEERQRDATAVQKGAAEALTKCHVDAVAQCTKYKLGPVTGASNTSEERAVIISALDRSLAVVQRVASDKYFGTPELQHAAGELGNISASLKQVRDPMICSEGSVLYCHIYEEVDTFIEKLGTLRDTFQSFKDSAPVRHFKAYTTRLGYIHALPYLLVLTLAFLTCCCKEGASRFAWSIAPFAVLWTTFFAVMSYVLAKAAAAWGGDGGTKLTSLNGAPSPEQVFKHVQATFPEIWGTALDNLASAQRSWVWTAGILLTLSILVIVYASCLCFFASDPGATEDIPEESLLMDQL